MTLASETNMTSCGMFTICCSQREVHAASNYHLRLFTTPQLKVALSRANNGMLLTVTYAAVVHPRVVCFFTLYLVSCSVALYAICLCYAL